MKVSSRLLVMALVVGLVLAFGAMTVSAADPTTLASGTLVFEGPLTPAGAGWTGTIPMTDESAGGGDSVPGFDVYARNGEWATYDKAGSGQDYACGRVTDHDAYTTGGGWGSFYDPDCADWYHYQLTLSGGWWYVEYVASGVTYAPPMSGPIDWTASYAEETGAGAYYPGMGTPESAGYALNNPCTGVNDGTAAWDMDWSWGSEYIPLSFAGYSVAVTDLGGGISRVVLTPAANAPAVTPPGPVVNTDNGESYGTIQAAIDDADPGDTLEVEAGVYTEALDVTEYVHIYGAGSDPAGTVISCNPTVSGDTKVGAVQLHPSGSGLSAGDMTSFHDLRVEPDGMAAFSVGRFTEGTGQSVSNIMLSNVKVVGTNINPSTEQERGLYVDLTSSLTGLVVEDCSFDNLTYGWYFQKEVSADASNVLDVTVTDTTFNHNNHKGVYVEKLSDATFTRCEVDDNGFDSSALPSYFQAWSCGVDINLKAGSYANLSFIDCTMENNATDEAKEGAALMLKARDDGGTYGAFPASLDSVLVQGGEYINNERGIRTGEPGKGNLTPTNVTIVGATISGNVQHYSGSDGSAYGGLINASVAPVDARGCYWGADAPGGDGPGTGDGVVASPGDVDCSPWLMAAAPTTQYGTYDSIQDAIDYCAAGDTINVWPGTYLEDLQFNKGLTVQGYSGTYTVDTTGQPGSNNAAAYVSVDNVTIKDMILDPDGTDSTPRYGLKIADVDGTVLENVAVTDAYRAGVDMLGSTNATLTDVTATANGGHGLSMVDCRNVTVTNLTSTGNGWAPVSVVTWGNYTPVGTWGIVFDGSLTYDGVFQLENGQYPGGPPLMMSYSTVLADGDDITVDPSMFTYALYGTDGEAPAYQRVFLFPDYATAATTAENATVGWLWGDYAIHDMVDQTQWIVPSDSYGSIQTAVDFAKDGDTINVKAGTYVEQVMIAKDLTVVGEGDTSVIQSPDVLDVQFTTSKDHKPIVCAQDACVTIQDLLIDGAGKGNANNAFEGIAYHNAGGAVVDVSIQGVRDTPFSGVQHGVSLYVYNEDDVERSLDVIDNTFSDIQKNAMALNANATTILHLDVHGNAITGAGPTDVTAQNGIQAWGALIDGVVYDNDVQGIAYTGSGWAASSILDYYADLDIYNNTVSGADTCVYLSDASARVYGNTFNVIVAGSSGIGIQATDPPELLPSPYGDEEDMAPSTKDVSLKGVSLSAVADVEIYDNVIVNTEVDRVNTVAVQGVAGWTADDIALNVHDNEFVNFEVGVYVYQSTSAAGQYTSVLVNTNDLSTCDWGVYSNADYMTVDATLNWWGAASGPGPVGPGSGSGVSDYVDYSPWYGDNTMLWTASESGSGAIEIPADMPRDQANAIIASAPPGATILLLAGGGCHDGGLLLTAAGITVTMEPGACITFGSPAFTVSAPNITLQGINLVGAAGHEGIQVASGGDNLSILDCEFSNWDAAVDIVADVTSFKMVGNYVHNGPVGLSVQGVTLSGVVTIEGNLFKDLTLGVESDADVDVSYNSWGMIGDPISMIGGTGAVTYAPWTFTEVFMDMEPEAWATSVTVNESESFDVKLKVQAKELRALDVKVVWTSDVIHFDGMTLSPAFASSTKMDLGSDANTFWYSFALSDTLTSAVTDTFDIVTLSFTAQDDDNSHDGDDGPWSDLFDISDVEAETRAGAVGGIKIFVNNAGFGDPSLPERDITDGDDGKVVVKGIANYTGFIDLQGRADDSGATVEISTSPTLKATATSASSGAWTSAHEAGELLVIGDSYDIVIDAPLYLATTVQSALLDDRPLTALAQCKLLGGDATDDEMIDIGDVSLIGSNYGMTSGFAPNADVNADGGVDILDLVLAAGNYTLTESPWTL